MDWSIIVIAYVGDMDSNLPLLSPSRGTVFNSVEYAVSTPLRLCLFNHNINLLEFFFFFFFYDKFMLLTLFFIFIIISVFLFIVLYFLGLV